MSDIFKIGERTFNSRLIVGTGKYKDLQETAVSCKSLYFPVPTIKRELKVRSPILKMSDIYPPPIKVTISTTSL